MESTSSEFESAPKRAAAEALMQHRGLVSSDDAPFHVDYLPVEILDIIIASMACEWDRESFSTTCKKARAAYDGGV
jgi:hypothetical protein